MNNAPAGLPNGLSVRAMVSFRPRTWREDDASVEFVLSTETPAQVWDWDRYEVIREVLVADGVILPETGRIPLQDSHSRASVADTLGSVREIRVEDGQVVGRLYFDKEDEKAMKAARKVRDGHIDSGSVGYEVSEKDWLDAGVTRRIGAKSYSGPLQISKRWLLKEYSLVAIGADPYAKVRNGAGGAENHTQEAIPMPDEIKVTTPGQPAITDAERAEFEANQKKLAEQLKRAERLTTDAEIGQLCARHGLQDLGKKLIAEAADMARAQQEVIEALAARQVTVSSARTPDVEMGATDTEKFRAAVTDAMLTQILGRNAVKTPAPGSEQIERITPTQLAAECLRRAGIPTSFMGKDAIIQRALSLRSSSAIPSQGTGDFTSLLANVATKTMMYAYDMAPATWRFWCKIGSLPDFKAVKRVLMSSAPELLQVAEFGEVTHGQMSDTGEDVQLVTLARKLVITRQALVNDDLDFFNTVFAAFGARTAAIINRLPYALLASNPTMADSEELFSSAHGNTANTAFSGTSAGVALAAMFQQKSLPASSGDSIPLNVIPKYALVGYGNMVAAKILFNSMSSEDSNKNAGVMNPYNTISDLPDANITTNSGKEHYYVADPAMFPAVEVAFLNGQQQPTLKEEPTSPVMGVDFTAFIDVTAKALDHRGIYRNQGG
jgi:HPt (histidine-containing phosphotransfer) domain-containing protein